MTFKDDLLELKPFCERLEKFLLIEKDYVEGSLVVALTGGFGSGKTTFLDMWSDDLLERRKNGAFCPMPLMLNAWESDHCSDPLLAILAELVKVADNWQGTDKPDTDSIKEAAKDVGWLLLGLADGLASKATGISPLDAGKFSKDKKDARKVKDPEWITLYHQRTQALKDLKMRLHAEFGGSTTKLLVFVDELDRCRPDYAVSYLETIKHIFDIPGMIFVLAIDREQLESSARALYGDHMNFQEYFRKFRHREISLPPRTQAASHNFIQHCVTKFLFVDGKRDSHLELGARFHERMVILIGGFQLQPRQIHEVFRLLGHLMAADANADQGTIRWGIGAASALLCCLQVARSSLFNAFLLGSAEPIELCREVRQALGPKKSEWWLYVILSGLWDGEEATRQLIEKAVIELQLCEQNHPKPLSTLSDFHNGWGNYSDRLHSIATKIVEVDQF